MKYFLSLVVLLWSDLGAQVSMNELVERISENNQSNITWNEMAGQPNDFSSFVTFVVTDSTNAFCEEEIAHPNHDEFHAVDLDKDGDLDLIFQGKECQGLESEEVLIYFNIRGNYHKGLSIHGRITDLRAGKNVVVYQYPCCAMIENSILLYMLTKDDIQLQSQLTYFDSPLLHLSELPESSNYADLLPKGLKLGQIITIDENAILNYAPIEAFTSSTFIKTNEFGKTIKEISATTFAMHIDDSGSTWYYCSLPINDIQQNQTNNRDKLLAWVNQKYLKK